MSLQNVTTPSVFDERAVNNLLQMTFKSLVVHESGVGGAERGSGGSKGLREGGKETCHRGRVDKHTYRRGLQAMQRRGQLVTELLQNHGYLTQRRERICVLSCAYTSVAVHVSSVPSLLLWPVYFVVYGWSAAANATAPTLRSQ